MQTATRRKETNVDIKQALTKLYLEGKSRTEAMAACSFDTTWDNNRMSVLSSRLKLNWSVPPENRQSGKKPASQEPAAPVPVPAQRKASSALVSKPSIQDAPKLPSTEVEKIQSPGRLRPSPGFIPASERWNRGIDDSRFEPRKLRNEQEESEEYINKYNEGKYG